jgi:ribokinase
VKFFVIGDSTVDHIYFLNHIPTPGEDVAPIRSTLQPGGAGSTMAYYLAQLGHEVHLAARVGNDPFQALALQGVQAAGVKLDAVQKDASELTSTITILVTPDAERAMISSGGANRNLDPAELNQKLLKSCNALLVSAYSLIGGTQREYAMQAMEIARQAKIPVFVDLGTGAVNAAGTQLVEVVKKADYLLMNQLELSRITARDSISDSLEGLRERGINRVVVKVGALGSIVWTPTETELLEGHFIDGVIDTTGSGDAFTAAFAHAILEGLPMRQAARYANVAGAIVATFAGAQSANLRHDNILERLGLTGGAPKPKAAKAPEVKVPEVEMPEVEMPEVKAPEVPVEPVSSEPEAAKPAAKAKPVRRTVKS